jgi:hypothetical protein
MSDVFCPEGFMLVEAAIVKAAHCWFPELLKEAVRQLATSDTNIDAAVQANIDATVQALEQLNRADDSTIDAAVQVLFQLNRAEWPKPLWDAFAHTLNRLRNSLHQGKIKAYSFTKNGPQPIGGHFWATSEADDVLETGRYWPNGEPSIVDPREPSILDEQRRPTMLFFMRSEVDALLSKQPKRLPESKIPEVAATLSKLPHLSRPKQHEELRRLYPQYLIPHRTFREVAKGVPSLGHSPTKRSREDS